METMKLDQNELTVNYLKRVKGELSDDQYAQLLQAFVEDMEGRIYNIEHNIQNV